MSRPDLLEPRGGLEVDVIIDLLLFLDIRIDRNEIEQWTIMERSIVADYCLREHLAASDNRVYRRDQPWLVRRPQLEELTTCTPEQDQQIIGEQAKEIAVQSARIAALEEQVKILEEQIDQTQATIDDGESDATH